MKRDMRWFDTALSALFWIRDTGFETTSDAFSKSLYDSADRIERALDRAHGDKEPFVPYNLLRVLLNLLGRLSNKRRDDPAFREAHDRVTTELRDAIAACEAFGEV